VRGGSTLFVVAFDGDAEQEGASVHALDERRASRPHPEPRASPVPEPRADAQPEVQLEALLARARRHDPAALRQLFELHKDRVAAQVQRMTGDPACVDDLVQ
jgi:RNA polymerase sigma-70 factor, ECF subfamily